MDNFIHSSNAFGAGAQVPAGHGFPVANLLMDQSQGAYHIETGAGQDHPDFWHLAGLVCEAVLEVVCVSSLGFIAAKRGLFPAKVQKDVANLNIYFFTPCLIFSKLAAQLTGEKLTELWIIPVILFVQTVVSWGAAELGTRLLKIKSVPQRNFVKAMAVFGNSNSLPLSLVISLSHTIRGLHWDKIPHDNDDEVGARGILYLLVFSQLGQAVRWSWGMNTLLRPLDTYTPEERGDDLLPLSEEDGGFQPFTDEPEELLPPEEEAASSSASASSSNSVRDRPSAANVHSLTKSAEDDLITTDEFVTASGREGGQPPAAPDRTESRVTSARRNGSARSYNAAAAAAGSLDGATADPPGWTTRALTRIWTFLVNTFVAAWGAARRGAERAFSALPQGLQKALTRSWYYVHLVGERVASCLNVPLVAIILSVLVGSVPSLKAFFYTPGSFVNNTVTSAVNQLAGVAVPVILFVLGGNLCKSTLPAEDLGSAQYRRDKRNMLRCAIVCRMLIPFLVMLPFLALIAKYAPVSILDDPIFIIVCFLLAGAPSALQLAQICQVNDVYVPVISQLLVQSYVVWIFPSTLVLVMAALEVVKWAA